MPEADSDIVYFLMLQYSSLLYRASYFSKQDRETIRELFNDVMKSFANLTKDDNLKFVRATVRI